MSSHGRTKKPNRIVSEEDSSSAATSPQRLVQDETIDSDEEDNVDKQEHGAVSNESDSEDVSDSEETTRTQIRQELSNLTFEKLLALKEKLGTKEYNEAMFGSNSKNQSGSGSKKKNREAIKRENKNRPREVSSKIRVPSVRSIVPVTKKTQKLSRDPRFAEDCGKLNEQLWNSNYSFLREMAKEEQSNLKQRFKQDPTMDDSKKTKMKTFLQRLSNKERAVREKAEAESKRRAAKKERLEQVASGKKPYYMKKSTKKYVELAEKYDQIKKSGGLESYMKKKRAKNAARDKKVLKI